eukprot:m.120549 g.120549  ORF g.120549 m.120549 type:complete len:85 (-) comp21851_c0_seq1:98-352(-)
MLQRLQKEASKVYIAHRTVKIVRREQTYKSLRSPSATPIEIEVEPRASTTRTDSGVCDAAGIVFAWFAQCDFRTVAGAWGLNRL